MFIRDIKIVDNGAISITKSIYTSAGYESERNNPKVKILFKVMSKEVDDIDALLDEYDLEPFSYEVMLTCKKNSDGNYESKPTVTVTKTIKDFYYEFNN